MTRCGFDVRFDADAAYVIHPESSARCTINFTDGIYTLPFVPLCDFPCHAQRASQPRKLPNTTSFTWHSRLHASPSRIRATVSSCPSLASISKEEIDAIPVSECTICQEANAIRSKAPPASMVRPQAPHERVSSDMFDMMTRDVHGNQYVYLFIDAYSRHIVADIVAHKSDALAAFQRYCALMQAYPRLLFCDHGGEYESAQFNAFCREKNINRGFSTPYEQYQNGVAESGVRLVSEKARALALQSGLAYDYWSFFIRWAVFLLNHLPSSSSGTLPVLAQGLPEAAHRIRAFGCLCFVHRGKQLVENSKLSPRGVRAVFLGVDHDRGTHCWLALNLNDGTILRSNHMTFHEDVFPLRVVAVPQSLVQNSVDIGFIHDMLPTTTGDNTTGAGAGAGAGADSTPTTQSRPKSILRESLPRRAKLPRATRPKSQPVDTDAVPELETPSADQVGASADDGGGSDQVGATTPIISWDESVVGGLHGLNYFRRIEKLPLGEVSDTDRDLVAYICDEIPRDTGFKLPPFFWSKFPNEYWIVPVGPARVDGVAGIKFAVADPNPKHKDVWYTTFPVSGSRGRHKTTLRELLPKLFPNMQALRDITPIPVSKRLVRYTSTRYHVNACVFRDVFDYEQEVRNASFLFAASMITLEHYAFSARTTTQMPYSSAPVNYKASLSRPDRDKWKGAEDTELSTLERMEAWEIVDMPAYCRLLPTQWVYDLKTDIHGNVRYKARIVVCGNLQTADRYETTFSPTARSSTIRTLCAIAVQKGLHMSTFDIRAAFISAHLPETTEIYIQLPAGHTLPPGKCARLKRALYGLRNASATYHAKVHSWFISHGFLQVDDDGVLFRKVISRPGQPDSEIIVSLYVDDGLSLYTCPADYREFMREFGETFDLSNDVELDHQKFLGMQLTYDREGGRLSICQSKYITELLAKHDMAGVREASTPMEPDTYLTGDDCCDALDPTNLAQIRNYQQLVGALLFLSGWGRPDIAYAVAQCARFMSCPGPSHIAAVKRILRYLQGTKEGSLVYERQPTSDALRLYAYVDADHAGDPESRLSVSGYIVYLSGAPILWASKRQQCSAISSSESEFYAASTLGLEVQYMRRLLDQLGCTQTGPTEVFEDNASVIFASNGKSSFRRLKHIDTRVHRLRQQVQEGLLVLTKVESASNVADIFTKAVRVDTFVRLSRRFLNLF
jgi:transposase InsO family protein